MTATRVKNTPRCGCYKENSTDDGDFLNCDASEFNLFIQKGRDQRRCQAIFQLK